MGDYKHEALKELATQQVRFVPPARRLQHLSRAEALLTEIDLNKVYPYQFLCYKITDFRPDSYANEVIAGQDVIHDLGLMIAEMARSMPAVPVESMAEPVLTLEEISKKLNVTTKTINRWRKRGLIGLPILVNGRRHVGFLPSLVDPFLNANEHRVQKSGKFSQLSPEEKDDILKRARRFVRFGVGSLSEISRRIARRLGRSPETVRYTIKNFDRAHPDQALFPALTGSFDSATKQVIYNSFRKGIALDTLAKRFSRTRSSMYRVVNEIRAQQLLDQNIEYIHNELFDDRAQESMILAPMPDEQAFEETRQNMRIPKDAPPELTTLYQMPLLTKEQEQHQFRKMNYLKYRAKKTLESVLLNSGRFDSQKLRTHMLDSVECDLAQASAVKDMLISCNMRLVVSIAKRHSGQAENFFELLSDGNVSLMRAVEKFDYSRGNKFSTYASWAIMKNFARSIPEEKHRRERYVTGNDEVFDGAADTRTSETELLSAAQQASTRVNRLLESLDPREREIIRMRAGMDSHDEGMTLEMIGTKLGLTRERVRQLSVQAMKKLRNIVHDHNEEL